MQTPYFEDLKIKSPLYPFSFFITCNKNGRIKINPHWHNHIELLYFVSGQADLYVGGENFTAKAKDMVLINACEVHKIVSTGDAETRYIVLQFDPEILHISKTVFELKYVFPFTHNNSAHQKIFPAKNLKDTSVPSIIQSMYDEYDAQNYGFELAVQTGICSVMLWILRSWKNAGKQLDTEALNREKDINRFTKLLDYVDLNFHEQVSLDTAAKMCNLSYCYFSRQFKKIMGKSFTEYLNFIRIRESEKLLAASEKDITETALTTGFSNSSYFIKQFKRYKGISPKKFKDRISRQQI